MNDSRDEARERDTIPRGLEPPPDFVGTPPDSFEGAPEYMRTFFQEIRHEVHQIRANSDRVSADVSIMTRQFKSFRTEARYRFRSLEEQLHDVEEKAINGDISRDGLQAELNDLRLQFEQLKGRVEDLEDEDKAAE